MECLQVLKRLNCKASLQLDSGLLEEARETANAAVNHFMSKYCATSEEQEHASALMLQWQTRVSILLLRKIGVRYETLGKQRDDYVLVSIGEKLLIRSVHLLRVNPISSSLLPPMKRLTVTRMRERKLGQYSCCPPAKFPEHENGSSARPDSLPDVASSVTTNHV
jgi:hypothetical protein